MGWKRRIVLCATAAWALALIAGVRWLWAFEGTAGAAGHVAVVWPADTMLARDPGSATLVMMVHPQCACSRASVAELARVVARGPSGMRVYVLAVIPATVSAKEWEGTSLLARAGEIPGVCVVADIGGVEARRFGAETSGWTSLYSGEGKLVFSGGITGARGHEGDNAGEDALNEAVGGGRPAQCESGVFGCPLFAGAVEERVVPGEKPQVEGGVAQ